MRMLKFGEQVRVRARGRARRRRRETRDALSGSCHSGINPPLGVCLAPFFSAQSCTSQLSGAVTDVSPAPPLHMAGTSRKTVRRVLPAKEGEGGGKTKLGPRRSLLILNRRCAHSARGVKCHGSRRNVSRLNPRPSACIVSARPARDTLAEVWRREKKFGELCVPCAWSV